jgi:hypothetical protein
MYLGIRFVISVGRCICLRSALSYPVDDMRQGRSSRLSVRLLLEVNTSPFSRLEQGSKYAYSEFPQLGKMAGLVVGR